MRWSLVKRFLLRGMLSNALFGAANRKQKVRLFPSDFLLLLLAEWTGNRALYKYHLQTVCYTSKKEAVCTLFVHSYFTVPR